MLYNSEVFWWWPALTTTIQEDIVYNGFWLQNNYIVTSTNNENNLIDFESFDNPFNNWRGFLSYFQRGKTISFNVTIKWDNQEDFNNRLDELRKALFQSNKNLDVKVNWEVRRIKASCISNPKNFNHFNINFLKTTIEFETLEPFFYELGYQSTNFQNKTTSFIEEISNEWSAEADLLFHFIFKTANVSEVEVSLWENTITINETIVDWDVLVIDWENKTVKLNNIEVDYLWSFPVLWVNINLINFDITGTFDADISCLNRIFYV